MWDGWRRQLFSECGPDTTASESAGWLIKSAGSRVPLQSELNQDGARRAGICGESALQEMLVHARIAKLSAVDFRFISQGPQVNRGMRKGTGISWAP